MAINSASDEPESVCDAMLQFEREQGTLDSFEMAMEKCAAQLKRVRERREMVSQIESCTCKLIYRVNNFGFVK